MIFACWLPYLGLSYPGIYWWDTTLQIAQFESSPRVLWNQHPFMDSLLFGAFAELGKVAWGDCQAGLFILITLQMIAAAATLSALAAYLERYGVAWKARFGCLLLFALFPPIPRMFCTLVKDTVFTPMFVVFFIMFCEIVRTKGAVLRRPAFMAPLALLCVGMGMSKKTGVLIVLGSMLLLVFANMTARLRAACVAFGVLTVLVCSIAIPQAASRILDIREGRPQESLALPIQQVANAWIREGDTFTKAENAALEAFYTKNARELAAVYRPDAVDPVKDWVDLHGTTGKREFLKIWLRHASINPGAYANAFAGLTAGWWSLPTPHDWANVGGADLDIPADSAHHYEHMETVAGWRDVTIGGSLLRSVDAAWGRIPVLNLLYCKAFWASIMPAFCLFLTLCRRRPGGRTDGRTGIRAVLMSRLRDLVRLSPMLLTAMSLYVGPTSLYQEATRYVFPLICVMPLALAVAASGSGLSSFCEDIRRSCSQS
ncbi:DUF6020 family protein [Bifidobacterium amazonense]|uniref:DUF6020 family protein n=1 Tax=Bifidobacterium amazonense TaxID=2809027 RepID=A0ABS9VTM6_9BIFI|nr:DUF6020 family protein [Bifidobacterium amazonense]